MLGKLVARLYVPDSGIIKSNGLDINSVSKEEFINHVIFVNSDEKLISSSLLDNILLEKNIDLKKLIQFLNNFN